VFLWCQQKTRTDSNFIVKILSTCTSEPSSLTVDLTASFQYLLRCTVYSAVGAAAGRPSQGCTTVLFAALKMTDAASKSADICRILTIPAPQTSMYFYQPGVLRDKKFSHQFPHCTYVHNIRHFSLSLCWKHVTDWNNNDTGGAGQFR
jgi:hypothetical protein